MHTLPDMEKVDGSKEAAQLVFGTTTTLEKCHPSGTQTLSAWGEVGLTVSPLPSALAASTLALHT